jgi:hypothetical protein
MKRTIGAVVALGAVLAFGSASHATLITYDVSGSGACAAARYCGAPRCL